MNNLCTDIGYNSINKYKEQLCGDHVEMLTHNDSVVLVLADGLGSGVKASILSTLTAKIISTMMAGGCKIIDCVRTITDTLPVCSIRQIAYSTFTIIRIVQNQYAEIIQYDNPHVMLFREGKYIDLPISLMDLDGKNVFYSKIDLEEGDLFVAVTDGVIHAGVGNTLNFGWQREDVAKYLESIMHAGFSAKTLSSILLDECYSLYGGMPGDDATVCVVKVRKRKPVNLLIGPPSNPADCNKMMSLFFSKEGKYIVCGGTTSNIAAEYLGKDLIPSLDYFDPEIPPTAQIEGVDLVTEGVITINKVLSYAQDYIKDNESYSLWSYKKDGASQIARMLFEEATDINFYVGMAVNPAHQNPDLPIHFNIKMQLISELAKCLEIMGKRILVSYF